MAAEHAGAVISTGMCGKSSASAGSSNAVEYKETCSSSGFEHLAASKPHELPRSDVDGNVPENRRKNLLQSDFER